MKAGQLDYKAITKSLQIKKKKAESRRIAIENEALIKRILNTPTTVPKKHMLDKFHKQNLKFKKIRTNKKQNPFMGISSSAGKILPPIGSRHMSVSTRNLSTADFPKLVNS